MWQSGVQPRVSGFTQHDRARPCPSIVLDWICSPLELASSACNTQRERSIRRQRPVENSSIDHAELLVIALTISHASRKKVADFHRSRECLRKGSGRLSAVSVCCFPSNVLLEVLDGLSDLCISNCAIRSGRQARLNILARSYCTLDAEILVLREHHHANVSNSHVVTDLFAVFLGFPRYKGVVKTNLKSTGGNEGGTWHV